MHYFLVIEVGYVTDGIILNQKTFSSDILKDCDFDYFKPVVTLFHCISSYQLLMLFFTHILNIIVPLLVN